MDTAEVKEIYNRQVKAKFGGDYEYRRWFSDALKEAGFQMTRESIRYHFLEKGAFDDYLELGSGSGTWTKLFLEKCPDAKFDLVDISGEMLKLAKEKLAFCHNVRYFEADFLDFTLDKQYDLFFSSRALEYIPDKKGAILKIAGLLKSGGRGFIITKAPKYFRARIFGRKIPKLHQDQIGPRKLKQLLSEAGFKNIEIYPATTSLPLFKSPKLNQLLFKLFYKFRLNFLSQFFSESYAIKFKKF